MRYFELDTVLSVATLEEIVENDLIYELLDYMFNRTVESYEYDDSMIKARSYLWSVYPVLKTITKNDIHCENCIELLRNDLGDKIGIYPIKKDYRLLKETKGYIKNIKD